MKLRDLSYLVAVAKTLHFGKAAAQVHVSQPTLSVQIKKLEDRLGVVLIERNNKNVRLTPAGEIIAQKATRILQDIEAIKTYAHTLQDKEAGDIHMGIIPTLGPYLMPQLVQTTHKKLPKLSLWLHEQKTQTLIQQLEHGQLDLAIMALPINNDALITLPLFTEEFYLAVNQMHPLAKKKSIQFKDLNDEKLLLLSDGHCMRDQTLSICDSIQTVHMSDFQATSLETLRHMVAQNLGVTLFPKLATKIATKNIEYIPFKKPAPYREIGLVFRKTHVRAELFSQMAKMMTQLAP
ncbi:MAG: LysR substrate-binding domain-containing protein [Gammaproteobacteria bacterium]